MPATPNLVAQIYENVGTGFPPQELVALVVPPLCHVPHKNWATADEEQNYLAVERWARVLHDGRFPVGFRLHIPHKQWDDPAEQGNYLAIERWALETQTVGYRRPLHIPGKRWAYDAGRSGPELEEDNYRYLENWSLGFQGYPGGGIGVPPLYPNLVVQVYENVT